MTTDAGLAWKWCGVMQARIERVPGMGANGQDFLNSSKCEVGWNFASVGQEQTNFQPAQDSIYTSSS